MLLCGLRRDNKTAKRYRLSKEQILACVSVGYDTGYPDCAVTLFLWEKEVKIVTEGCFKQGQTIETLVKDMELITDLKPEMVGIGPFIPHHATPFSKEERGTVGKTVYLLSLIRLIKPNVLLPATTALGSIYKNLNRN